MLVFLHELISLFPLIYLMVYFPCTDVAEINQLFSMKAEAIQKLYLIIRSFSDRFRRQ